MLNRNWHRPHVAGDGRSRSGRNGSVFLYVIWVVLLLSIFAVAVAREASAALNLSDRLLEQFQARYAARGAVQIVISALQQDLTPAVDTRNESWSDDPWLFDGRRLGTASFRVTGESDPTGRIRHGLVDEERRINLNTVPAEVLARLANAVAGLPPSEAAVVGDSVADWRDEDDIEREDGAEGSYYRSRGDSYPCKDGLFENVEELLLVRGVTPAAYHVLEPYLTVHGSGQLNLNTASAVVLRALGLSEEGVQGFLGFRAGNDGEEMTGDDQFLTSIGGLGEELESYMPDEDRVRLARLATKKFLTVNASAFRATITAWTTHHASLMHVVCVVDAEGRVLSWSEY